MESLEVSWSLPANMAQQSSGDTPGHTSFVFRSRPKTSRRAKPPYTPKRVVREAPRQDASWAPGVPGDMLFVHRIHPDNPDKMYARADWNEATGPLDMYEGMFDLSEVIGTCQGGASEPREGSVDGFSSRSQSSHGYTSSEPQTPIEPTLSPYPALSFTPNNKSFTSHMGSSTSGELHYRGSLHPEQVSLVYGKSSGLDGLGYSPSIVSSGSGVVTPQAPGYLRLSHASAEQSTPDYPRGTSPEPTTSPRQEYHDDLQNSAHLQYPILPQDLEHHTADHSHHDVSNGVDHGEDRYHSRPLHPKSALFPVDPRQFHPDGLESRRHSLPTTSGAHVHALPPMPTQPQNFLGPNQSPYYASLMPPRTYPRLPDRPSPAGDPSAPGQLMPWPPSLAQFPGPRRFEHQDVFSYDPHPPSLHYLDNHGVRPFTSLSAVTIPLSCPSSPSRPTAYLGPGVPGPTYYSAESRPEMPKRAASWTAHFESLPAPKLNARPRKSRAKGQPVDARVPARSKTIPPVLPPGVVLLHKCPLCPRAFERRNGLAIHLKWHYKPEDEKPAYPQVGDKAQNEEGGTSSQATNMDDAEGDDDEGVFNTAVAADVTVEPEEEGTAASRPAGPRTGGISITHLLAENTMENGPITPLATPPPSPGLSNDEPDGASGQGKNYGHHRSQSRPIWPELFGSDG